MPSAINLSKTLEVIDSMKEITTDGYLNRHKVILSRHSVIVSSKYLYI